MIILGSQSPRRREIFNLFRIPHKAVTPHFDEASVPFTGDPEEYVCSIAKGKAESLARISPANLPILTADSIVFKEGKIFGKPANEENAFQMLQELSGSWHTVYTGLALYHQEKYQTMAEATEVLFNPLTSEQIRSYHRLVDWRDKAGAYAIQMGGGIAIRRITGCYYNVMGLPVNTMRNLLNTIGIDLWDYLS
ncbi:Maf-like protein pc0610 [Waddlia chondrophila 2032/99]|uniref:dTTP/UTP pyrophosphatase n=2 Tax=Waddlia chondrophila TaxID=71667 RepID=D6YWL1_WADCW|nr:nucleoside triphosphate pyrophosphatase [Waddlia chondrophila]ADI38522.1 putative Maf-like protein [Waddlia chondrophila WSU 86-1044]CCB91604.1 Maf-like protein pc0610 [Waddlia chondrophila 2032/99]